MLQKRIGILKFVPTTRGAVFLVAAMLLLAALLVPIHISAQGSDNSLYLPLVTSGDSGVGPVEVACPISGQEGDDAAEEQETQDKINEQRASNDLPPLTPNELLTQAARYHAHDMVENNHTNHEGSDGSKFWERIQDACYEFAAAGEILAWGYGGTTDRVIDGWMNSDGHRDIIMSDLYTEFGAGFAESSDSDWNTYWVVEFALPLSAIQSSQETASDMRTCRWLHEDARGGYQVTLRTRQPCTLDFLQLVLTIPSA